MDIKEFKNIVAQNIYYLRTVNHMTQFELGEKLNYSDKAISKWERGDGLPDVFVIHKMSELFGVTVDYIMSEHTDQDKKVDAKPIKKAKRMIANIVFFGIITIALLVFVVLALTIQKYLWQIFVFACPICAIVGIVFSSIWERGRGVFFMSSVLVWSVLATIFCALLGVGVYWQIFLIGIPLQIIVFLCFRIKITITFTQKDDFIKKTENKTLPEGKTE